jgi:hypothetical protein
MAGCLGELLLRFVVLLLLLPVGCILCTPIILILSFFGPRGYWDNVKDGYHGLWRFWCEIVPHA